MVEKPTTIVWIDDDDPSFYLANALLVSQRNNVITIGAPQEVVDSDAIEQHLIRAMQSLQQSKITEIGAIVTDQLHFDASKKLEQLIETVRKINPQVFIAELTGGNIPRYAPDTFVQKPTEPGLLKVFYEATDTPEGKLMALRHYLSNSAFVIAQNAESKDDTFSIHKDGYVRRLFSTAHREATQLILNVLFGDNCPEAHIVQKQFLALPDHELQEILHNFFNSIGWIENDPDKSIPKTMTFQRLEAQLRSIFGQ
ncbi:MAG: hypothetical protein ABI758_02065 [Candidatus Woesebacteria bacterium]